MLCCVASVFARPQATDYSAITDVNDPRYGWDVSIQYYSVYRYFETLILLELVCEVRYYVVFLDLAQSGISVQISSV